MTLVKCLVSERLEEGEMDGSGVLQVKQEERRVKWHIFSVVFFFLTNSNLLLFNTFKIFYEYLFFLLFQIFILLSSFLYCLFVLLLPFLFLFASIFLYCKTPSFCGKKNGIEWEGRMRVWSGLEEEPIISLEHWFYQNIYITWWNLSQNMAEVET